MSTDDLAIALATASEGEASVVQSLLRSHGIQAVISTDRLGRLASLRGDPQLTVLVMVAAGDVAQAREILGASRAAASAGDGPPADEARLEAALGYRFANRGVLEDALTHRSRVHEDPSGGVVDNESMEFLGDAVLGFVIADLLYRECQDQDEGGKSKLKATLVSAVTLSERARALGLGAHLVLGKGEECSGGRSKSGLLADAYEAVIAAIYLDGGIDAARAFIEREFLECVREVQMGRRPAGFDADAKSALQEWTQAHVQPLPAYSVIGERGPDHAKIFEIGVTVGQEVVATATGRSKKEAEQRAAALALQRLRRGGSPW